ncbi:MAG TPA: M3 family metallopeptidase [Longimicrobiales bacterium]|nr:M3 family metallopeptidase [Longimicrobiales bacterium]
MDTPDSNNPLLEEGYRIPFQRIRAEDVVPAVRAALEAARTGVAEVVALTGARTYANTIEALDDVLERLERVVAVARHLLGVKDSPALRAAYEAVNPEIAEFEASLTANPALWSAVRAFSETAEAAALDPVRRRHVAKWVRAFVRSGAALAAEARERAVRLKVEHARLTKRFAENVLDSTNAFELVVTDAAELAGLPETDVARARASAASKGLEGWRFTLHGPSYVGFMENAERRELRRVMYEAYTNRATEPERDNRPLLREILRVRRELARTLGYGDYADFQTEERMAGTGARALEFERDLLERTRPHFAAAVAELDAFARERLGYDRLEPWDAAFVVERLRKERYELDPEELRPFFPLDGVLAGLFETARRVFGLGIEEAPIEEVWHPDVRYFEVRDEAGTHIGSFYADFFPRTDKRGGAWMDALITGRPTAEGFAPHLALLAGNFTPPQAETPSLLTKDEVETLFHEFGHVLHQILSRVEIAARAGTNVAWDFVELPSQLMENWTWEAESLAVVGRHHRTGAPIPAELFRRLLAARTFMGAYYQMRQLAYGTVDLELHTRYDPEAAEDPLAFAEAVLRPFAIRPDAASPNMLASFTHIFSGGYAAGYYSYKWAEVLDADTFTRFEREGVFNRETGRAYVDAILSRGDSADPLELFREFMGRDPDPEPLLRRILPTGAADATAGGVE